jgi:hypothetical protein
VVKRFAFVLFLLLIAVPTFAQDTYPRIQTSFGYANFSLPVTDVNTNRHNSGFTTQFDFNFTKALGFDYYMGYYSLGAGTSLFSNLFGARLMVQGEKVSPYLVAAIGAAQSQIQQNGYYYSGGSALASRFGGGFDYKASDVFGIRVEVTKMPLRSGGVWLGKMNVATGIVFTLMQ